jgi:hypothetical protein
MDHVAEGGRLDEKDVRHLQKPVGSYTGAHRLVTGRERVHSRARRFAGGSGAAMAVDPSGRAA